jgi:uncharacterized membrane protein
MTGIPDDRQHAELQKLNSRVSILLRISTFTGLLLVLTGLILSAVTGTPLDKSLTPLFNLPGRIIAVDPAAFVTAGIVLILLLPAAMVVMALAHFITMRERNPIIACAILLAMLAVSFIFIVK